VRSALSQKYFSQASTLSPVAPFLRPPHTHTYLAVLLEFNLRATVVVLQLEVLLSERWSLPEILLGPEHGQVSLPAVKVEK
jgi:hypothetical protein